jgi:glycosyltransferase involved in cell wall biosynthesis
MPEPDELVVAPYPSQSEARQRLAVPPEAVVFLHYGLGTRRKGLHHVLAAWQKLPADCPAFLLAAGQLEPEFLEPLQKLQSAGRVHLLNRYIGSEEEQLVMAASNIVLMPYVNHYGSSNVLSKAAAANRMVLASDQGLVGYRVRQYQLGEICAHNDAESLHQAVIRLAASDFAATGQGYTDHLRAFAAWGSPDKLSRLFAADRE